MSKTYVQGFRVKEGPSCVVFCAVAARENTHLSPSLTPTLGRFLEFLKPQRPLYHSRLPRVLATAKNSVGNLGFGINTAAVSVVNANNIGYGARSS